MRVLLSCTDDIVERGRGRAERAGRRKFTKRVGGALVSTATYLPPPCLNEKVRRLDARVYHLLTMS